MKKCFITLIMVVGFALASTFNSYSMEAYAPQQKTVTNTDKSVERKIRRCCRLDSNWGS